MESITGVFGAIAPSKFKFNNDDDSADKLNHRYTTVMLIIFAVIVSSKQFVGDPIQCWVPAHFSGSWQSYANSYCWVKNTYYLPFEDHIPKEHEEDKRHMIPYYQWVPLILLTQALLFYIPRLIWRSLNTRTSIDVDDIVRMAEGFQKAEMADKKENTMSMMALQMHRFLASRNFYGGTCTLSLTAILTRICCIGRRTGNYLSFCFLMSKFLYIVNLIGQLFLMNAFLGQDFHFYGIDVLRDVANGTDWRDSPRFPRVTMCDFIIRMLGNNVRYTVQCVLSINLFNEMIFLLIWFWLVLVSAVSVLNFIRWTLCTVSAQDKRRYIRKQLKLLDVINEDNEKDVDNFINEYLRTDGVFICRIIGVNTDAVTVTEFVCDLFKYYTGEKKLPGEDVPPSEAHSKSS